MKSCIADCSGDHAIFSPRNSVTVVNKQWLMISLRVIIDLLSRLLVSSRVVCMSSHALPRTKLSSNLAFLSIPFFPTSAPAYCFPPSANWLFPRLKDVYFLQWVLTHRRTLKVPHDHRQKNHSEPAWIPLTMDQSYRTDCILRVSRNTISILYGTWS